MPNSKRPTRGSNKTSVSGPTRKHPRPEARESSGSGDQLAVKLAGTDALSRQTPFNPLKKSEYGRAAARPEAGHPRAPPDPVVTGSTLTESVASAKVGTRAAPGENPGNGSLDRVRTDSGGRGLTTNQGVPVSDNQSSVKAGLRGPTLLEDFVLRDKITSFDHERIPERVVHARGSAAHGYFECSSALTDLTRAAPFAAAGKRTPVFVRFSTVVGERGSPDLARDVRFAVKFYTDEACGISWGTTSRSSSSRTR